MEKQVYQIEEGLWQLYIVDCQMNELTPNIKDFLVWLEEEGYDLPEEWNG